MRDSLEQNSDNKKVIKSVLKALSVIELLDEHGELGVTEISELLDIEKSTVFRILSTLKEKNFITSPPRSPKYRNSAKFFALGQNVLQQNNFNPVLEMEINELAAKTGEAVNFAVPEGKEVVIMATRESEDWIKLASNIGQRRPMYCTSLGKAILAHYKPGYSRALSGSFSYEAFTEYTIGNAEQLLSELKTIRERGYSTDEQEHRRGLCCIGVALLNNRGEPMGAVSVSMSTYKRAAEPDLYPKCLQALLEAAPRLTAALTNPG